MSLEGSLAGVAAACVIALLAWGLSLVRACADIFTAKAKPDLPCVTRAARSAAAGKRRALPCFLPAQADGAAAGAIVAAAMVANWIESVIGATVQGKFGWLTNDVVNGIQARAECVIRGACLTFALARARDMSVDRHAAELTPSLSLRAQISLAAVLSVAFYIIVILRS